MIETAVSRVTVCITFSPFREGHTKLHTGVSTLKQSVVLDAVGPDSIAVDITDCLKWPLTTRHFTARHFATRLFTCGLFTAGFFTAGLFACRLFTCRIFTAGLFTCGVFTAGLFACR
jgi:hypothetical protein